MGDGGAGRGEDVRSGRFVKSNATLHGLLFYLGP